MLTQELFVKRTEGLQRLEKAHKTITNVSDATIVAFASVELLFVSGLMIPHTQAVFAIYMRDSACFFYVYPGADERRRL